MMRAPLRPLLAMLLLAGALGGCQVELESRDPWRGEAEQQCLAEGGVLPSGYMEPLPAINGPGECGMDHPFQVLAFEDGTVALEPKAKLACPVIRETEGWIRDVIQPAAMAWIGEPVVAIKQMSSYSCRPMNGQAGAKISEHAFGNALDIGGFRFAGGRVITVKNGWKGTPEERGFLLQVQAGACDRYRTVLAPGSNVFHYDHIHVDLMRHAKGRSICKPAPKPMPMPARPPDLPVKALTVSAPPTLLPSRNAVSNGSVLSEPLPPPEPEPLAPYGAPPQEDDPPAEATLPPGWLVGPQGHASGGPMSFAGPGNGRPATAGPFTGNTIAVRKYYSAPIPQPSTIPLPTAKPGED